VYPLKSAKILLILKTFFNESCAHKTSFTEKLSEEDSLVPSPENKSKKTAEIIKSTWLFFLDLDSFAKASSFLRIYAFRIGLLLLRKQ